MGQSTRRLKTFDLPFAPANRIEANRWLQCATFGPATARTDLAASTKTSIVPLSGEVDDATRLMSIGYEAYINEQLLDTSIPGILANFNSASLGDETSSQPFLNWFYGEAIHGSAQIRLKLAYALSQIFVINGTRARRAYFYYDNLVKATLNQGNSSFRVLMDDVSRSLSMADYLTYINNRKLDVANNIKPDQNFSRERMQLFTIGLFHRNIDGSPVLDSNGFPVPTYLPDHVRTEADVWTGYTDAVAADGSSNGIREVAQNEYLLENIGDHELGAKVLFPRLDGSTYTIGSKIAKHEVDMNPNLAGYVVQNVTANTFQIVLNSPSRRGESTGVTRLVAYRLNNGYTGTEFQCQAQRVYNATTMTLTRNGHGLTNGTRIWIYSAIQESVLESDDWLFNHPNVGPFIAENLIKFFVTSNPTRDFIKRVATKFNNNGSGVRGDLAAVVKAILLDRETIVPFGINPNNHGRHMSVVDRDLKVARALRSDSFHINYFLYSQGNSYRDQPVRSPYFGRYYFTKPIAPDEYKAIAWGFTGVYQPYNPKSVFNHFDPMFTPRGTTLGDIGKTAPELQVNSIASQAVWANQISALCETDQDNMRDIWAQIDDLLDNRGNRGRYGHEYNVPTGGIVVSSKINGSEFNATTTFTDTNSNLIDVSGVMYHRRTGVRFEGRYRRNAGTGATTLVNIFCEGFETRGTAVVGGFNVDNFIVGDIIDLAPRHRTYTGGFPTRSAIAPDMISYGGSAFQPLQVMLHKVANLIPDTAGTPSAGDLTPAINYLESILFGRPISDAGKALAIQQAQVTVTPNSSLEDGNASIANNWRNLTITRAQKRARYLLGILLALPEFSVQR